MRSNQSAIALTFTWSQWLLHNLASFLNQGRSGCMRGAAAIARPAGAGLLVRRAAIVVRKERCSCGWKEQIGG